MNYSEQQLIQLYLSNLQVNVTAVGYNQVWSDWRELDYVPDYNKFYFIQDGEGWLKIGDKEYNPTSGQWFMLPHGVKQSYSYTEGMRYTKYWCHFTAKIGQNNLFDLIQTPIFFDTENEPEAEKLFQELIASYTSDVLTSPLLVKSVMLKLISYYIEHATSTDSMIKNTTITPSLFKVMEYIHMNFKRNITISELAEQIHLHPNYFSRVFKQQFGTSPIQYVNNKKIEEAKWLMISTNLPLSEISHEIGLTDVAYFSRLFKALTGFSPTVYRDLHRTIPFN